MRSTSVLRRTRVQKQRRSVRTRKTWPARWMTRTRVGIARRTRPRARSHASRHRPGFFSRALSLEGIARVVAVAVAIVHPARESLRSSSVVKDRSFARRREEARIRIDPRWERTSLSRSRRRRARTGRMRGLSTARPRCRGGGRTWRCERDAISRTPRPRTHFRERSRSRDKGSRRRVIKTPRPASARTLTARSPPPSSRSSRRTRTRRCWAWITTPRSSACTTATAGKRCARAAARSIAGEEDLTRIHPPLELSSFPDRARPPSPRRRAPPTRARAPSRSIATRRRRSQTTRRSRRPRERALTRPPQC
jgi:hypothetical protein